MQFQVLSKRYSRIGFGAVDAGLALLLPSHDHTYAIIRGAYVVYEGTQGKKCALSQYLVQISRKNDAWDIAVVHNDAHYPLEFSQTIVAHDAQGVVDTLRIQVEEHMLLQCSAIVPQGIIAYDGLLGSLDTKVVAQSLKNNALPIGVAKQISTVLSGASVAETMFMHAQQLAGKCGYARDEHTPEHIWCKLHPRSEFLFCLSFPEHSEIDYEKVIGIVALYSQDPVFEGYPYPLILADQLARIPNDEKERLTMKLAYSGRQKHYQAHVRANPHAVLDTLQF